MPTTLVALLTLVPLLGLAGAAHAHAGDQIYPFLELLDQDLERIDLTDGSVEDWYEVLGEPSLVLGPGRGGPYRRGLRARPARLLAGSRPSGVPQGLQLLLVERSPC